MFKKKEKFISFSLQEVGGNIYQVMENDNVEYLMKINFYKREKKKNMKS